MLGNWSLGDYFKEEQIPWIFNFVVRELGIPAERLYVTVYEGSEEFSIPRDTESVEIWQKLFRQHGLEAKDIHLGTETEGAEKGMQGGRIFYYGEKNWWSRTGSPKNMPAREPGGPDTEMFYEFTEVPHNPQFGKNCHPNCDCGRFMEIGNSVFMEYQKTEAGGFEKLRKRNVDFGGGLERMTAALQNTPNVFDIDVFQDMRLALTKLKPSLENEISPGVRIILDHIRASVMLVGDGVLPGNKDQGYVLRRLIRRSMIQANFLQLPENWLTELSAVVIDSYQDSYPQLTEFRELIQETLEKERIKFEKTLLVGLQKFEQLSQAGAISGQEAFDLHQSYGFPFELTEELAKNKQVSVDKEEFVRELEKHKALSRAGAEKKFGGHGLLLDSGELKAKDEIELKKVTRLHTATHLLQAALRKVLGEEVSQAGSDITAARTRFDFNFPRKLTDEEISKVADLVNSAIDQDLPMQYQEMEKEEAAKTGALYFFKEKYPATVKVYFAGNSIEDAFSKEFCGGPHVNNTGAIGRFKILKEESVGTGIRRIRATVE